MGVSTMIVLRTILPELHRDLLPALFDESVPDETLATCNRCTMALPGIPPEQTPEGFFRPDVKCCSFHPNLPNFLVGAVLADERPDMEEGRRRVRARIESRIGVGPVWLSAPRKYTLLFLASRKTSFGRSLVLRCPYFDPSASNCSIWRHRDSVCTTFFCKHERGAEGDAMWRSIEAILRLVERRLAEHAAMALGAGIPAMPTGLDTLTLEELEDRHPDFTSYTAVWKEWAGREEAYYRACRDIVANLDRSAFERLTGDDEMAAAVAKAQLALDRAQQELPGDTLTGC
jgi:Fe-S-cluster containining protein